MLRRTLATLAAATALSAVPAGAAEIQIVSTGPVIELSVTDTVNAKPDSASVSAGVTTRALTANEAARDNARRMDAIIARIKQTGIAAPDIQTSNFSLYPQYTYANDGKAPTFIGYDVSNQVTVKIRDVAKIGSVLDAMVAAGANNFNGPVFMLENDTAVRAQARRNAFASAEARARELAALAGFRSVKLLEVSETYQTATVGGGIGGAIVATAVSRNDATPIQPGLVGTAATLVAKYEAVR